MTRSQILLVAVLEIVALTGMAHLWLKRRRVSIGLRLFWTLVLLVPLVGIIAYGLTRSDPDEHPYDEDATSHSAASEADGGGGGHA